MLDGESESCCESPFEVSKVSNREWKAGLHKQCGYSQSSRGSNDDVTMADDVTLPVKLDVSFDVLLQSQESEFERQ